MPMKVKAKDANGETVNIKYVSPRTWLRALKSGKFTRTTEQMAYNGGNCCLGVLCRISGADDILFGDDEGGETGWTYDIPSSKRPDWMIAAHHKRLIILNDRIHPYYNPGWEGTGVLEYIEKYCIPRYDKLKAEGTIK